MYKRGKTDTEFDYDGEGLRHEMEENGKLFTFIFRGTEIVAEESKEDKIRYIRTGELLASDAESARTYYHYASDEMGSITYVAAGEEKESGNCTGEGITGSILNRYEYDAWGNLITCEEKSKNRFKYNGQQHDQISGQYYLRARYYNPVIGRFTQEDTYRGDGLNLYAYCKNNPVYYVDPSGHICETEANRIMDKFGANGECGASRNEQKKLARYLRNKDRKGGNLSDNERRILNQIDDYTYMSRYDNQTMPGHLISNGGPTNGYFKDSNGRWRRPNGEFASNAEVGLPSSHKGSGQGNKNTKQTGSYTITFIDEKGNYHEYHGKGSEARMRQSAREKENKYNVKKQETDWTPASSDIDAFIDEYIRLEKGGGHRNNKNYNKIQSPGKKYLEERNRRGKGK